MNNRIREIADQCHHRYSEHNIDLEKFSKLLIESVLDEVKERAYYTGDRDWSDEVDRPWIQLEFGYGQLSDAKKQAGIK
jgi:hypothetical protein